MRKCRGTLTRSLAHLSKYRRTSHGRMPRTRASCGYLQVRLHDYCRSMISDGKIQVSPVQYYALPEQCESLQVRKYIAKSIVSLATLLKLQVILRHCQHLVATQSTACRHAVAQSQRISGRSLSHIVCIQSRRQSDAPRQELWPRRHRDRNLAAETIATGR
jgi:hypothetical protein